MALFFNQRKPRPFDYKPRYYDPEKEAREERKKIVLGEKYKAPGEEADKEYVPGAYLRQHVQNRRNNMEGEIIRRRKLKQRNISVLALALVVLIMVVWILYFR